MQLPNLDFSYTTSIPLRYWPANDRTSVGQTTLMEQRQIAIVETAGLSFHVDNRIWMEPFGSEQFSNVLAFASLPVPNWNNGEFPNARWGHGNITCTCHVSPIVTTGFVCECHLVGRLQLDGNPKENSWQKQEEEDLLPIVPLLDIDHDGSGPFRRCQRPSG